MPAGAARIIFSRPFESEETEHESNRRMRRRHVGLIEAGLHEKRRDGPA